MINKIYTYYVTFIFVLLFLITFPIQLVLIQFESTKKFAHLNNFIVIKIVLFLSFIKIEIEGKNNINTSSRYIICSNHSSYLDIPSLFILQFKYVKFIGKESIRKVPLFGYMYRKLYIMVNRRDKESRNNVISASKTALNNNCSIAIYPEGAIPHNTPELIPFKDGAFRLSIEEKTPILPVTLPFNHLVMPIDKFLILSRKVKIIIHKPLNTEDEPIHDMKELKNLTYNVIENELKKHKVI